MIELVIVDFHFMESKLRDSSVTEVLKLTFYAVMGMETNMFFAEYPKPISSKVQT